MAQPPYHLTEKIVVLVSQIAEAVGRLEGSGEYARNLHLRKVNRIRSIQSSLAIENNSLGPEQVTAIINGKQILGNPREIKEVKNAYQAYERLLEFDPFSLDGFLQAHKLMTADLVKSPGHFRTGDVGVYAGTQLIHVGARPAFVPDLIQDLFVWAKSADLDPLIKSCVVHFEIEFIHPFADGNGRIGRLWQTLILSKWREIFAWLPIETVVYEHQSQYYDALNMASKAADSTIFIEFMLSSILAALNELPVKKITDIIPDKLTDKLTKAELLFLEAVGGYLENNDELTNFRAQLLTNKSAESVKKYLQKLVQLGVLKTSGENKGRKYRLVIKNNYGDGIQVYQCQKRCDLAPKNGL